MNQEKYVKAVVKKIKCSNKKKAEIKRDLEADIQTALENGEEWEQIKERMGKPSSLAVEFNENLSKTELQSFKRTRRIKVILIIIAVIGLIGAGIYWMFPKTYDIEKSSTFDKNTVIHQAETVIDLLNKNDYDTIKNQYANAKLGNVINGTTLTDAKNQIGTGWGEFKAYTSIYTVEAKQLGTRYAVVQITALYENRSVMYTITFDENMKLAGLYMK